MGSLLLLYTWALKVRRRPEDASILAQGSQESIGFDPGSHADASSASCLCLPYCQHCPRCACSLGMMLSTIVKYLAQRLHPKSNQSQRHTQGLIVCSISDPLIPSYQVGKPCFHQYMDRPGATEVSATDIEQHSSQSDNEFSIHSDG